MSATLADCERIGRTAGLAAGLAAALAGVDVPATAPGRYAAVPAAAVPAGAAVRTHRVADPEQVVFLEVPGAGPDWSLPLVEVGRRTAAVRLGVLRAALDGAITHLAERESGGEPLLAKQLVTGTVADVAAGIDLLRAYAESQQDPAAVDELHAQLDHLGWQVLALYGAAGYVVDHPARALYAAVLVANTWTGKGDDR